MLIEFYGASELLKFSPYSCNHQMPTGKADIGMSIIKLPIHAISPCIVRE